MTSTAEALKELQPYPKGMGYGDSLGFAFHDGKRYKIRYASDLERAWCECTELCDQELWDEAEQKLDEYQDLCVYKPDQKLITRVICGRNQIRSTSDGATSETKKEVFEESLRVLKYSLFNEIDDEDDETLKTIIQLLSNREFQLIFKNSITKDRCEWDHPDYEDGSTGDLIAIGKLWSDLCGTIIHSLGCSAVEGFLDLPVEKLFSGDMIIPTLVKREALDESMEIINICLRHIGSEFYHYSQILACKAELAEMQEDFQSANNSYTKLLVENQKKTSRDSTRSYDKDKSDSFLGDELCPPGSISDRITRTETKMK